MTTDTQAAERAYLDAARDELARMRARTLALDARGGDAVLVRAGPLPVELAA